MIIHKCDLCKKECNDVSKIQVPKNKYWYATGKNGVKLIKYKHGVEISNIEICSECTMHIADLLDYSLGIYS